MSDDTFLLYGTRRAEEKPRRLTAGRLSADLADGNLRTITYDGVEVLRAVSYIIRDRDWGTYSPRIENLVVDQQADSFSVSYRAYCSGPDDTTLTVDVSISATERELVYNGDAVSATGFETNRCGFCILHPIVGIAGTETLVEHVDGSKVETRFPDQIEPWQPFKDMRAISHTVAPDVTAECRMEGDTFEMEDQRNWSDASYKTYVRPLALPWPYRIEAGEPVGQRVVLRIDDRRGASTVAASNRDEFVKIDIGTAHGTLPSIGLVVTPEEASAVLAARDLLSEIAPQEIIFHFDPDAGHGSQALKDFAGVAAIHPGRTTLEIALPCKTAPVAEALQIAQQMRSAGFSPDAIMISPSVDRQSTPPGSTWPDCPPMEDIYAAAKAAFPGIRLGGGMLSYFTELNRKRVPTDELSFISHCTNPIVHAADDTSVMQTLEALPFITRSVRAIFGGRPYRIGPSTIPMRQNPYGSRTMDNPDGHRIAMANQDPRHNGLFAAAFAAGYAARVVDTNLETLTLSSLTGAFGLSAGTGEPVPAGEKRPLAHVVRWLASIAGWSWQETVSSYPAAIQALLAWNSTGDGLLLVANVTASTQDVVLPVSDTRTIAGITVLDADSIIGPVKRDTDAQGRLRLAPFATAAVTF